MCTDYRKLDPKSRRLRAIANASLVLGLTPWIFREYLHVNSNWLHAFCGIFLGVSIAANFFWIGLAHQCRSARIGRG